MPSKQSKQQRRGRQAAAKRAAQQGPVSGPSGSMLVPNYGPVVRLPRTLQFDLAKGAADQGYYYDYALSDVSSSNEFTALFTEWRLESVCVTVIYNASSQTGAFPRLLVAMDPMAKTAPSSANELEQRRARIYAPNPTRNTFRFTIRPAAVMLSSSDPGSGSLVTTTLMPQGMWQSCDTPQLGYGRLLVWGENYNSGNSAAGTLRMSVQYNFGFRGVR